MNHRDLTNVLSGCRFYRRPEENADDQHEPPPEPADVDGDQRRQSKSRIFKRYCLLLAALVAGSVLLIITPLWLAHPPYGKAFLLSLPPMAVVALSWMAGAWWAWDRGKNVFMVATMGGIPLRLVLVLAWAWLVISIPGVPVKVFLPALMLHWALVTVPEIAMLLEFSRKEGNKSVGEPRP
jgi:hypothetical protein